MAYASHTLQAIRAKFSAGTSDDRPSDGYKYICGEGGSSNTNACDAGEMGHKLGDRFSGCSVYSAAGSKTNG